MGSHWLKKLIDSVPINYSKHKLTKESIRAMLERKIKCFYQLCLEVAISHVTREVNKEGSYMEAFHNTPSKHFIVFRA